MNDDHRLTRRQFTQLSLAGAVALLASCGSDDQTSSAGTPQRTAVLRSGVAQAASQRLAADPGLAGDVVSATNRFAADLYALAIDGVDNLAFSPLSIAIALAMTDQGARGTSRTQIEEVFHLTDVEDPNGGWNALDQALASRAGTVTRDDGTTDELRLTVVNRLWGQAGFPIEEPFLTVLAASYGAGVNLLDFAGDPEAARTAINAWVAEQTNNRIPELIAPGIIDDLTRLVLTNAVYFKAPWAGRFDKEATKPGPFTLLDNTTVEVPLMSTDGMFGTHRGDGWQAVELAYADKKLEMVLVVPGPHRFAEVEARLGDGLLDEIPAGLERSRLLFTMPTFDIRTPLPLRDPLEKLGMPDPFGPDIADFSAINPDQPLYLQDVVHQAFVAVDETGTEAAASTAVIGGLSSLPPTLVVDRPFLWAIRDVPTRVILFLGRVVNPSLRA
jgi:serpin B